MSRVACLLLFGVEVRWSAVCDEGAFRGTENDVQVSRVSGEASDDPRPEPRTSLKASGGGLCELGLLRASSVVGEASASGPRNSRRTDAFEDGSFGSVSSSCVARAGWWRLAPRARDSSRRN